MLGRLASWIRERWNLAWVSGASLRSATAIAFALTCVASATLVRMGVGLLNSTSTAFAPYYAAILISTLIGGAVAGGTAAIASILAAFWLFVPHEWNVASFRDEQAVSLILFLISSAVIIWAAESHRALLRRLREEAMKRQLLNSELAHRIKNTIAGIQAIVAHALRDQPELLGKVSGRIVALGKTHDLLHNSELKGVSLKEILLGELLPYGRSRFELTGEDLNCPSALAIAMALIFHELATNAAKYGAISSPRGRVLVCWRSIAGRLMVDWQETGGPEPKPRGHSGFGTRLLQRSLEPFNGLVAMDFKPTGLHVGLSLCLTSDAEYAKDAVVGRVQTTVRAQKATRQPLSESADKILGLGDRIS